MVAGSPQRLWVEEKSQHFLYHPLCHQSCLCLCHLSAPAQLEPQLEDRKKVMEPKEERTVKSRSIEKDAVLH